MINKIKILVLIIFLFGGCDYKPIYSNKSDNNFSIEQIDFNGDILVRNAEDVTFGGSGLNRAAASRGTEKAKASRGDSVIFVWRGKILMDLENQPSLAKFEFPHPLCKDAIEIFTDSQYVKNGITEWINTWVLNNWKTSKKEDVKNKDLWIQLYNLNQSLNVKWNWIKAHAGDPLNEEVDMLAKKAANLN